MLPMFCRKHVWRADLGTVIREVVGIYQSACSGLGLAGTSISIITARVLLDQRLQNLVLQESVVHSLVAIRPSRLGE